MRHSRLFALAIVCTSLVYNNCAGFTAATQGSFGFSSMADGGGSEAPLLGVDPHPEDYPPVMGTPAPRNPGTLTPVTTWPVKQAELPLVPSNFNVGDWIGDDGENARPAWNGFDDVGAFRMICKPSHNLYDDPAMYPGQPGASHLHTFFGNTSTNANSTYATLRANGDGTCQAGPLNRSGYWYPALRIDGGNPTDVNDQVVMPDFAAVYYKMPPLDSTMFARGLKLIFGYNMSNPAATVTDFFWQCNGPNNGAMRGSAATITALAALNVCLPGDDLEVSITAPTCWNGQLDSPDHRSHVVNVQDTHLGYNACPADHPYHFPAFHLAIHWTLGPTGNSELQKMYLSSDHMPDGTKMTPGSSFHTDWFGAWDDSIATEWMGHADAGFRNCSGGQLCDGRGMKDPFSKMGLLGYHSIFDPASPRVVNPPVHP